MVAKIVETVVNAEENSNEFPTSVNSKGLKAKKVVELTHGLIERISKNGAKAAASFI